MLQPRTTDFKDRTEAMKVADDLIAQNTADHEHEGGSRVKDNPLLPQLWYVQNHGKKRSFKQTQSKILGLKSEMKSQKQLEDLGMFMKSLGSSSSADGNPGVVQEENAS